MKLFVNGRKSVFTDLENYFSKKDKIIWLHAASLGEYEQGVPILQKLKSKYPEYKILITFFSPSGYEVKKNNDLGDFTTYLPLDTPKNAKRFIKIVNPDLALFIKYEVWPNYLKQLAENKTPTLLVSGNFRKNQIYFKSYGKFMRKALASFDHLFVQNKKSAQVLKENQLNKISISGDTRFDRVSEQLEMNNQLDFIEAFKEDKLCVVFGSSWPADEDLYLDFINQSAKKTKFIIAPHEIKKDKIKTLKSKIQKEVLLYSAKEGKKLADYQVFIIDTVGLLTKIYAYANIAYVGGAAGNTGLHNILEPAAFGLPVIIGKNHRNFPEAQSLKGFGGLFDVSNAEECFTILEKLTGNPNKRKKMGKCSENFVRNQTGATQTILKYIKTIL